MKGANPTASQSAALEKLRRQVSDYRTSFNEVKNILESSGLHRAGLEAMGMEHETNRFLNWVRLTFGTNDAWKEAPLRPSEKVRHAEILRLGREWTQTQKDYIPESYVAWFRQVRDTFGSSAGIRDASRQELTDALMSIHAFEAQTRYMNNLSTTFWTDNQDDVGKVKRTLNYLVHGGAEFAPRLYEILEKPSWRLKHFATSCAIELYGTIKPQDYPPVNLRIAKGLRYLGFNVIGE